MPPLEVPRCTQDETRRREDKSHSLNNQFGRVSVVSISNLYLEGLKPSLYRRRTGQVSTRSLHKKLTKGPLKFSHI